MIKLGLIHQNTNDQYRIQKILAATFQKLKQDDTILCHGKTLLNDCNNMVCKEAIALREFVIYADVDEEFKKNVLKILSLYGGVLDGDYNNYNQILELYPKVIYDNSWIPILKVAQLNDELEWIEPNVIVQAIIRHILLLHYQEVLNYTIPNDNYDKVIYSHKPKSPDPCNSYKHHYKCLHDPSLDWEQKQYNKYDIEVTYKELKQIALQARDSGGHLDFAKHAHENTLMNCVHMFVANKLNLNLSSYCRITKMDEELEDIIDTIWLNVPLGEFYIDIY